MAEQTCRHCQTVRGRTPEPVDSPPLPYSRSAHQQALMNSPHAGGKGGLGEEREPGRETHSEEEKREIRRGRE
jgi:hypothetical protein